MVKKTQIRWMIFCKYIYFSKIKEKYGSTSDLKNSKFINKKKSLIQPFTKMLTRI